MADNTYTSPPPAPSPLAYATVARIEDDLCSRPFLLERWDRIDAAIKDQIRDEWARRVQIGIDVALRERRD
jgi:hypothetical protein